MTLHRPHGSLSTGSDPVSLTPERAGWSFCGLHVLRLEPGEHRSLRFPTDEVAVVPLSGSCEVETAADHFELTGRTDVFSSVTDLCYLGVGSKFEIWSEEGGEFALATARASHPRPARYHPASDVAVEIRGAGAATRQINGLLSADVEGPEKLIVVEVLTPEGNWSSYPPHKHDELSADEVPLEEIYYFRIDGDDGFGFHRTYTSDGEIDETVTVVDGDVFLIPRGYHGPCVAAPGYDMYYLNVMAGPAEERVWLICTDPRHAWVWDAWAGVPPDPRLPMTKERE